MSQISARLPDELIAALDEAAAKLHRTRAQVRCNCGNSLLNQAAKN